MPKKLNKERLSARKKVSLTAFTNFLNTGKNYKRKTIVKASRVPKPYSVLTDYWKVARDGIRSFHNKGFMQLKGKVTTRNLKRHTDSLEAARTYLNRCCYRVEDGYKKSNLAEGHYDNHGVVVKVRPELCLKKGDQTVYLKLYFNKREELDEGVANQVLAMMADTLSEGGDETFAIFDVVRGEVFESRTAMPTLLTRVNSKMKEFAEIWADQESEAA